MSFSIYYINYPYFLLLLSIIPVLIVWYVMSNKNNITSVNISSFIGVHKAHRTFRQRLIHLPFVLRMFVVFFIILALTQPVSLTGHSDYDVEAIDIIFASDISGSMLAEDFKPNRLEASRNVAFDFIDERPDDRIGLVVFSSESFLQCALTSDHVRLKESYSRVYSGMVTDGTAIGDGLGMAVYHLRKSEAVSKVIILLTDGINNAGSVDPVTAAEIAKKYAIRVYTIGVGTKGMAPYPFRAGNRIIYQNVQVQIDEDLLKRISEITGGKYFRATNESKLKEIYKEIDRLEKSKINVTKFNTGNPHYLPLLVIAAVVLLLEILFRYLIFKKIP